MVTKISKTYIFFFVIIFFHVASADEEVTHKPITWWCSTTPNPDPCNHFMGQDPNIPDPITHEHFRTMTISTALTRAIHAQTHAKNILISQSKSDQKIMTVHLDCKDLIDDTIHQLNTTLNRIKTKTGFTNSDIQTWLSTALTNIEICRSGSRDLNMTRFSSPVLSGNVSELISNSLAANNGALPDPDYGNGFLPGWVALGERKLLQDMGMAGLKPSVVVAKDGSGQFGSVQEGIEYAVANRVGEGRVVVYVKRGVYEENVLVNRTMSKVMLIGDGIRFTVITGSRSVAAGYTTFSSATFGVDGAAFMARGITFRNTAGPSGGQAVALRSSSDLSIFYACAFEGYQDTLFAQSQRQFFKSCHIYGTVDVIFGNAALVVQNSVIYARNPLPGQANMITAQGRGDPFQNTGISIHNCRVMPAPDLKPFVGSVRTYLGRPWQQYSRTVIMKSYLDGLVDPAGWSRWGDSDFALTTLYYGEFGNFGPGAETGKRVDWPGYHVMMSPNETSQFTVTGLISGRAWLPATGVPFISGL